MVQEGLVVAQLTAHLLVERKNVLLKNHRLHRVLHQHDRGQHVGASGNRRDVSSHIAARVHIDAADNLIYQSPSLTTPTANGTHGIRHADIDHRAIRLQTITLDLHRGSLRRDHVIRLHVTPTNDAYILQEGGSQVRMIVRHLANHVLVSQKERNRQADAVASSNHSGSLLLERKLVRLNETQSGKRRGGEVDHLPVTLRKRANIEVVDVVRLAILSSATFVLSKLQKTTLVRVAATVHILDGTNRRQNSLLVQGARQRRLHDNSVDRGILVQLTNLLLHLLRLAGRIKSVVVEVYSTSKRDILLLLNETIGIRTVVETQHSQSRNNTSLLFDMLKTKHRLPITRSPNSHLLQLLSVHTETVEDTSGEHHSLSAKKRHC